MKDALSVPSPSRFWSTFGMRSAARNASAYRDVPKKPANAISRASPEIRLKRMPAATHRAERACGSPTGASASLLTRRQRSAGRGPALQQLAQEIALVFEPLEFLRQAFHFRLERRDPAAQALIHGCPTTLDPRGQGTADVGVEDDGAERDQQHEDDNDAQHGTTKDTHAHHCGARRYATSHGPPPCPVARCRPGPRSRRPTGVGAVPEANLSCRDDEGKG